MSYRPVCEYIDVDAAHLTVGVHLRGGDEAPGARFELRARSRGGRVAAVVSAEIGVRVNTVGKHSLSALTFTLDMARLSRGGYRLELREAARGGADGHTGRDGSAADSASAADAGGWTPVGTTPGLLANSREIEVGGRRFQVLPAAGASATWIRLGELNGSGRAGWRIRNWLRELAFIAHARRFSWVRPAKAITAPFMPSRPIWLVGERPETARDNGFAFFSYLRRQYPNEPIYYLIRKDSPMAAKAEQVGNVVWHSSMRHRILMLHASVLANAYSIKHMLPSRWRPGAYMNQFTWRVGAWRIYLKHGVHLSPDAVKRANGGYDLIATVGERESQALAATSGYGPKQLKLTGLARYDNLVPQRPSKTILFMPTWRRYLVPKLFGTDDSTLVEYHGSTYERFITAFLSSRALAQVLAKHDLELVMVPHYNLASVLTPETAASDRIKILDGKSADIPALLRSCALLVTDYSSVQFDVAYVGAPIVYAQFDREEYAAGHAASSWFDLADDAFGPVYDSAEGTIEGISRYAEAGFEREETFTAHVSDVFTYQDRSNRARLVAAIEEMTGLSLG